jgi:DNA mismatch repair protein MutS2
VLAQQDAGTPFPFGSGLLPALAPLQFAEVLEVVSGFARGPLGKARVQARLPTDDSGAAAAELRPVAELLPILDRGTSIDIPPVPELEAVLTRLRVPGSVLNGVELVAIRQTLQAARVAHGELRAIAEEAPAVAALLAPLPEKTLEQRLSQSLDDEGELLDAASPRLQRARQAIHGARDRLVKKLEAVLRDCDARAVPAGGQVTIRRDRYVIPVRRDSRARPEGIIHDESTSQETLFVEPTAAIEFGNALRSAIVEAEREALQVLRELTERARPAVELIGAAHEMCVAGDDLVARVRYAHAVRGTVPRIGADRFHLAAARHPLLLARGLEVVPFDLDLAEPERTLLISGPNAGGKTVLLKTIGLTVLLAQAGIAPPVAAGTELPVFRRAFADIGDHQSIAADLSTFSAHLTVLREVLETAGPETLVLIDEIGSGTDPAEGGALAAATLRELTALGAFTVATTHLGVLKTLAGEVPGIVNGSLNFDAEQLRPSFRFRQGVPGRSYGLAIAQRLGIAAPVLERARRDLPDRERALDELLAQVERRARDLEEREAAVAEREGDLEAREAVVAITKEAQAARTKELERRERELERTGRREARRHLLEARELVESALRSAREGTDPARAKDIRRRLEGAVQEETAALEALDREETRDRPTGLPVEPGRRVRLAAGGTGVVHELRGDGKVVVALGAIKVIVDRDEVTAVAGAGPPSRAIPRIDVDPPTAPSEIDLRGLRADEAAAATVAALDAAVLAEHPVLRIIHGMGTGAVRDRVRQVLQSDRRVARFAFAPRNQGGTGVTVAEFEDAS